MNPLDLVQLTRPMAYSTGRAEVVVGLVDGPVVPDHSDLNSDNLRHGTSRHSEYRNGGSDYRHGTFVAGVIAARRDCPTPGIVPDCTLLVCPAFTASAHLGALPGALPADVAAALVECVDAGAAVLNLSAALSGGNESDHRDLSDALRYATDRGVVVVVAAGNQGGLCGSAITNRQWVLPVASYASNGQPMSSSTMGLSIGRHGLGASGDRVSGLAPDGGPAASSGTSVAAAFVTGAVALLLSAFAGARPVDVRHALLTTAGRRHTVAPPLMNAWGAFQALEGAERS